MATTSYGTPYVQSSDLVSGWPNASLNVANRIDEVSYAGNGINAQTGTTYTLVVGDAGKTVTLSNAAAVAVTLPQDSVANLPTGAVVNFYNLGAGTVTISAGAGATLQGGSLTAAQYGYAAVIKLSANTYGAFPGPPTTPGLSIITPTSTANSGGSVTATGGQIVFSGVTSVSLNGCFTSTYDVYRVMMSLTHSGTANLSLRLRASGTDNSAASYDQAMIYQNLTTAYGANDQNQTSIGLSLSGAYIRRWSTMDIYQPNKAETTYWGILHGESSLAAGNAGTITGLHDSTNQFDGLSLIASTGSITGTIRVYGYKNS